LNRESILKRLFPSPYLSLILFVLWLVLNQSLSAGHVLLGLVLGIVGSIWTAPLRPSRAHVRSLTAALKLIVRVTGDVFVSNWQVAKVVWRAGRKEPASEFVRIPLELRDAYGLAALAMITTVVPGTVWSELAVDRSAVLLHLVDTDDPEAYAVYYKQRYERPLMEIFE
jgi:multicomponent K+:H+ antiporter subunit E